MAAQNPFRQYGLLTNITQNSTKMSFLQDGTSIGMKRDLEETAPIRPTSSMTQIQINGPYCL